MKKTSEGLWQRIADRYAPVVFLAVLVAGLSASTGGFATGSNLLNIARQHSIIIVLAVGQTMVMISGGIDLSVGFVMGFASIVSAKLIVSMNAFGVSPELSIPVGIIATLGISLIPGYVNGTLVAYVGMPPFMR